MRYQRLIQFLFWLLPFVFFWQTRFPLFNQYQISDYLIGFVYVRDVVVGLFVLAVIAGGKGEFWRWVVSKRWFVVWCVGLILFSALSIIPAPLVSVALFRTVFLGLYCLFALCFGYVLVTLYKDNQRWYGWWNIPFVVIAVLSSYEVIMGRSAGFQFLGEWTFSLTTLDIATVTIGTTTFLRPYATFPHPNVLGGVSVVFLTVLLYQWHQQQNPSKWALMGLAVLWFLVIISFSRSAWLGLILVFGLYVSKSLQDRTKRRTALMLLIGVCIFALPYFLRLLDSTDPSVIERVELVNQALTLIKTYPLLGVGNGNFVIALEETVWKVYPIIKQPVHIVWLLVVAEIGVIGGLWFLGGWIYTLLRIIKNTIHKNKYVIVSMFGIVFVTAFFDHYWWSIPIGQALFWWIMGYSLSVLQWETET